jgi:hypothetical protein
LLSASLEVVPAPNPTNVLGFDFDVKSASVEQGSVAENAALFRAVKKKRESFF